MFFIIFGTSAVIFLLYMLWLAKQRIKVQRNGIIVDVNVEKLTGGRSPELTFKYRYTSYSNYISKQVYYAMIGKKTVKMRHKLKSDIFVHEKENLKMTLSITYFAIAFFLIFSNLGWIFELILDSK